MSNISKIVAVAAIVVAIVIAGIALGWLGSRTPEKISIVQTNSPASVPVTSPPETYPPVMQPTDHSPKIPIENPANPVQPQSNSTGPALITVPPNIASATNLVAEWEEKVSDIVGSETNEVEKGKQLLGIFWHLPPDVQEEAAHHLSNLVPDEDYSEMAKLLTNSTLPADVLDVLLADALNRPNILKLPALLDVAKDTKHPNAEEAKDLLELYLDEDYGNDWNKWREKMTVWLKENPE
jgi:hypothetical protein